MHSHIGFVGLFTAAIAVQGCWNPIGDDLGSSAKQGDNSTMSYGLSLTGTSGQNFYRLSKIHRGFRSIPGGNEFVNFLVESPISGYTDQGLSWYVFDNSEAKSSGYPIYELHGTHFGYGNFMASKLTNEAGYGLSYTLGKVEANATLQINNFNTNHPLRPMNRYYREWDIDPNQSGSQTFIEHMVAFENEDPTPGGYIKENSPVGFAFPRYGYEVHHAQTNHPPVVTVASRGDVRVGIIPTWGGSIGSIIVNNREYVNRSEPGTLLSMATRYPDFGDAFNPTEGGDMFKNGSPSNYTIVSSSRFRTTSIPLMWRAGNDDVNHPYIYGGEMSKDVEILSMVQGANIIRYTGSFRPMETRNDWILEMPAFHLNLAGIYESNGTATGWNSLYTRSTNDNSLVHRTTYSRQISAMPVGTPIDWRELRLNNSTGSPGDNNGTISIGSHILLLAHNNTDIGRAVGVVLKSIPNRANAMSIWNRDWDNSPLSDNDYGPAYLNTNHLCIFLRQVNIAAGTTFTRKIYLLFGSRQNVIAAANNIIGNPNY